MERVRTFGADPFYGFIRIIAELDQRSADDQAGAVETGRTQYLNPKALIHKIGDPTRKRAGLLRIGHGAIYDRPLDCYDPLVDRPMGAGEVYDDIVGGVEATL